MKFAKIAGISGFLPEKIVTNEELSKTVDTTDQWIMARTGIKQRHIIDADFNGGLTTGYMAWQAAAQVLRETNTDADEIDAIIVATTTNDRTFPSCATYVQKKIGATNAFAFDMQAVCSGFLFALVTANNFIQKYKKILVIGAETMSRIVDWADRNTCVLFGDGAGAVLLEQNDESGIIDYKLESDGNFDESLQAKNFITMDGRQVFKLAIEKMTNSIEKLLERNKLKIDDISYVVPHQANERIIQAIKNRLDAQKCEVISTVAHHANTSAASIPLALNAIKHKLKKGDLICLTAFGGGFTWGGILFKY